MTWSRVYKDGISPKRIGGRNFIRRRLEMHSVMGKIKSTIGNNRLFFTQIEER